MMDTDTTRSDTCRCDKLGVVLEVQDGSDMSSRSDIGTPRMTTQWPYESTTPCYRTRTREPKWQSF